MDIRKIDYICTDLLRRSEANVQFLLVFQQSVLFKEFS